MRELKVGEAVMVRPLMYEIETDTGLIWKRHVDHLKSL